MSEETELKKSFESASLFVRSVSGSLEKNYLLYFYARFKQVQDLLLIYSPLLNCESLR